MAERFLILTRAAGLASANLEAVLAPFGRAEIIVDRPELHQNGTGIWYPDELLSGYAGIMGDPEFPALTAWSRAIYHLDQSQRDDEAVWFVEDDVAGDPESFRLLVAKTLRLNPDLASHQVLSQAQAPGWYWWPLNRGCFDPAWKSFNPICRLSPRLLTAILAWRQARQHLIFHEILFASMACRQCLRCLDWAASPSYDAIFPRFRWRPEIEIIAPGISHPVKNPALHSRICRSAWSE